MDHQQSPQPNVEIVYNAKTDTTNTDRFLEDARAFNEMSSKELKKIDDKTSSSEGLIQGVINNHAELRKELELLHNAKKEHLDIVAKLNKSISATQENLKKHESATLANTTAMLEHTKILKDATDDLVRRVDLLENTETPRLITAVEGEQKRSSALEQNQKNLTEKFKNLVETNAKYQSELTQKQETLDTRFTLEQTEKNSALQKILKDIEDLRNASKEIEPLRTTVKNQDTTIINQNNTINTCMRKIQLLVTANVAILCASIWIWFQTHKT